MAKYRKKPVVIEAMRIPEPGYENRVAGAALTEWMKAGGCTFSIRPDAEVRILTLEGDMIANPGDWIVKGVAGEFYPVKSDIFDATYEPASKEGGRGHV